MERSEATFEAYDGVRVPLPSGRVVTCRALPVKDAVKWLRRLDLVENPESVRSQNEALIRFYDEFARAVGVEAEPLSPAEVMDLARSFLRLPTWSPQAAETTRTAGEEAGSSSTPASMI